MPEPRMKTKYKDEVVAQLVDEFSYGSVMQVPRLAKIVLNVGLGEAVGNARALDAVADEVAAITGQKPIITVAKKSIANFKIRDGNPIGVATTMRGNRMWEFFDRTVNAALPRVRDFQGVSRTAFDGRGNFSLGLREQIVFPEIDFSTVDQIRPLQIIFVTTATNDEEGRRLLELLGMPFARIN
jgi:large subunit ribosomal protein L5